MNNIKRLIATERRDVIKLTLSLLLDWRASRAERERWRSLRAYHRSQMERWRERL